MSSLNELQEICRQNGLTFRIRYYPCISHVDCKVSRVIPSLKDGITFTDNTEILFEISRHDGEDAVKDAINKIREDIVRV